jgi:hypothetical protein
MTWRRRCFADDDIDVDLCFGRHRREAGAKCRDNECSGNYFSFHGDSLGLVGAR